MKRTTVYSTTALAAVLMGGILSLGSGHAIGADVNDPMIPAPLMLDESHHGATLDARVEQYIVISLQDPWDGAYGWDWQDIAGDPGVLRKIGRSEHPPGPWYRGQDTGRPERASFRLVAVNEGQATVTLICTPPPGIMAPVRLYQVTLNVRP